MIQKMAIAYLIPTVDGKKEKTTTTETFSLIRETKVAASFLPRTRNLILGGHPCFGAWIATYFPFTSLKQGKMGAIQANLSF
jgi:hypothetical protein